MSFQAQEKVGNGSAAALNRGLSRASAANLRPDEAEEGSADKLLIGGVLGRSTFVNR